MIKRACLAAAASLVLLGVGCGDDSGSNVPHDAGVVQDSRVDSQPANEDTGTQKPDSVAVRFDLGIDAPVGDGPATTVDGPATTGDGPVTTSDGPVTTSDGPVTTSDGPVTTSDGPVTTSDGPVTTSDGPAFDGLQGDGSTPLGDAGVGCNPALIGAACTADSQCGGGICLQTHAAGGVCTCPCNLTTDDCPNQPTNVCGEVLLSGGQTTGLCFKRCTPQRGSNACQAPLACTPDSIALMENLFSGAYCAIPGCTQDSDCPVSVNETCNRASKPNCTTSGATCRFFQGSDDGQCVVAGSCEVASGLCISRNNKPATFNASAGVGSPCSADADCGPTAACFTQGTSGSRTVRRNGYCAVPFCEFSATWQDAACPTGSACNVGYTLGLCQRSCDPASSSDCRGNGQDQFGDYECYRWSNVTFDGVNPVSPTPVCDWGIVSCSIASQFFGGCELLGLLPPAPGTNPQNMRCRNIATGADTTAADTNGFCLDNTASGP